MGKPFERQIELGCIEYDLLFHLGKDTLKFLFLFEVCY
jgi:hypothetical protein